MPTFNNLGQEKRDRIIDEIWLKIDALVAGKRKLSERRDTTPGLTDSERILIKLEIARLDLQEDLLQDRLDAFELSELSIKPPSPEKLSDMKEKIVQIRKINVSNKAAKAIMNAVVAVSGALPKKNLT